MFTTLDRPDLLVRTVTGSPIAVVEVTNPVGLTADRAAESRRLYADHGFTSVAPYFLLISQDEGHLWREPAAEYALPSVSFPMSPVVHGYLPDDYAAGRLLSTTVESIVYAWLSDLMYGLRDLDREPERTLVDSGFIEAITRSPAEIDAAR